ncbi:MAG TPA: hypothetical protein VLZ06_08035 [Solirubrobacteraceae bacterium]|nr:hypothetical protein [Solirubrobacteraceae bacterium]
MAIAAVALAAFAGACFAAVTAPGQSSRTSRPAIAIEVASVRPVPASSEPVLPPEPARLQAAADYLGIPVEQLTAQLTEGRSLAQIADAIPGKSEAGLIQALVQQRREQLAKRAETLPKRVKAAVLKLGGPGSGGGGGMLAVARAYLGITAVALTRELRSGKTLGGIAESTPGRSREGLGKALYAAREHQLKSAAQAGRLSEAATHARLAHVQLRVDRILSRTHHKGAHKHAHRPAR